MIARIPPSPRFGTLAADVRTVIGPARPFVWRALPSVCAVLGLKALVLVQPLLLRYLVDTAVAHRPVVDILWAAALIGLWHVIRGIVDISSRVATTRTLDHFALTFRHRLLRRLLADRPPSVSGIGAGELLVRVTDDVEATRTVVQAILMSGTSVVMGVVGGIGGMALVCTMMVIG